MKFIDTEQGFSASAPLTVWTRSFWVAVGAALCSVGCFIDFSGLSLVDASSVPPLVTFLAISVLAVGKDHERF